MIQFNRLRVFVGNRKGSDTIQSPILIVFQVSNSTGKVIQVTRIHQLVIFADIGYGCFTFYS